MTGKAIQKRNIQFQSGNIEYSPVLPDPRGIHYYIPKEEAIASRVSSGDQGGDLLKLQFLPPPPPSPGPLAPLQKKLIVVYEVNHSAIHTNKKWLQLEQFGIAPPYSLCQIPR